MESLEKLVIIGSGPAGLTAAIYGSRANMSPVAYMGSIPLGQLMLTSDVENYPGFPDPVLGPDLMERMKGQAERLGARLIQEDVVNVNFDAYPFELETSGGAKVRALSVVVATGATPRRLNIASEARLQGKGVSNCAVCDGFFFKGKNVAVVGGGDTAMEEATFLTNLVSSVQVIHRKDELRASAALREEAFKNPKIKFNWNSVVTDIIGNGKVDGLTMKDVKTGRESKMAVDGVFVAIGYEPNTKLFEGKLALEPNGYIKVKNETETSVPGVFAAGDVRDFKYRQAVTAAADGCKAVLDAEKFIREHAKELTV
ncbi:MAG TPA: thioredoxin-disulfide reductase [Nitrososphaerales archaeon]|nr:thioredoxin-disulfide reductase [Nitrososphaerales archaeon]